LLVPDETVSHWGRSLDSSKQGAEECEGDSHGTETTSQNATGLNVKTKQVHVQLPPIDGPVNNRRTNYWRHHEKKLKHVVSLGALALIDNRYQCLLSL